MAKPVLTPEQIKAISQGSPTEIAQVLTSLVQQFQVLQTEVDELKRQLGRNSGNSHMPPSSDGPKQKAERSSTPRKRGGKKGPPQGHEGYFLKIVETPDEVKLHRAEQCPHCHQHVEELKQRRITKRQVIDIDIRRVVIEHQVESGTCPHCSHPVKGAFPEEVTAAVQYGETIQALSLYLNGYQLLPLGRTVQTIRDLLEGHGPCEATILRYKEQMSQKLEPHNQEIIRNLLASDVLHVDETSLPVQDKRYWLHVAGNSDWTHYHVHAKRGVEGILAGGVLDQYQGVIMHDFWKSYFDKRIPAGHAMCQAHLLRELQEVTETHGFTWAERMQTFLREVRLELAERARQGEECLSDQRCQELQQAYGAILRLGFEEHSAYYASQKRASTKPESLWRRFVEHGVKVLYALWMPLGFPLDNNQAERDIRMCRLAEKISGCFRSVEGVHFFAAIRTFISTIHKQKLNILNSLQNVLSGTFSFA